MVEYYRLYTRQDIDQAFNKGIESAIFVLEKAEELSPDGIQYMVESLKKLISESEVSVKNIE